VLHLEKIVRRPLDILADLVPVHRPIQQRSQNQHVQRALQQIGGWRHLSPRRSTTGCRTVLSNVKGSTDSAVWDSLRIVSLEEF
jgi:hypothetical protein